MVNKAIDDFEDLLAVDAMLFETIRYKHEYGSMVYNFAFLYNFAVDLHNLCKSLGISL